MKSLAFIMNRTVCERCSTQLQIPLIDEHQQLKSCKAIAARIKASASQNDYTVKSSLQAQLQAIVYSSCSATCHDAILFMGFDAC